MKLLLDENLSRRLVPALQQRYPGSSQVALLGLERADDRAVWEFARLNDFVIVTRDDDFRSLLNVLGHPPKVILLSMGNCANQQVLDTLLNTVVLRDQLADAAIGMVELY